jgi:hypothetical protein
LYSIVLALSPQGEYQYTGLIDSANGHKWQLDGGFMMYL